MWGEGTDVIKTRGVEGRSLAAPLSAALCGKRGGGGFSEEQISLRLGFRPLEKLFTDHFYPQVNLE